MIFFSFFKKIGFGGILGPPSYGIGATIRIGREMLCLPYAGFFFEELFFCKTNLDNCNFDVMQTMANFEKKMVFHLILKFYNGRADLPPLPQALT